jgi:hypothetical protein
VNVQNFIIGLLAGGFLVGTVAIIVVMVKAVAILAEMLTIVKTIYIEGNKTQQMVHATMEASENFVDALNSATVEMEKQQQQQGFFQVFRTQDGKHVAPSFEKLIEKMKSDPDYQKITEKDMDELRRLFEDNSNDDEDDSDEEPKEPWKGEEE